MIIIDPRGPYQKNTKFPNHRGGPRPLRPYSRYATATDLQGATAVLMQDATDLQGATVVLMHDATDVPRLDARADERLYVVV